MNELTKDNDSGSAALMNVVKTYLNIINTSINEANDKINSLRK